jgi:hypothetical protein
MQLQQTHLLAIAGATALTFVILFALQYRQEKQLKEFRIRQSQVELRVLELEQSASLMAASDPIQVAPSRRSSGKSISYPSPTPSINHSPVIASPVSSVSSSSSVSSVSSIKQEEMSEEMRREIEYMEHELDTMEKILENDASKMVLIKMVNKYADNTLVDFSKVSNVSDDDGHGETDDGHGETDDETADDESEDDSNDESKDDSIELKEESKEDHSDDGDDVSNHDDESSSHEEHQQATPNDDASSIMVTRDAPIVTEHTDNGVDGIDVDDFEDEDICSSEMEIIIQSAHNDIATQATNESHYIVSDDDESSDSVSVNSDIQTQGNAVSQEREIEHWMNQFKVNELKEMCRREGVSQAGLKRELLERLIQKGVRLNGNSSSSSSSTTSSSA